MERGSECCCEEEKEGEKSEKNFSLALLSSNYSIIMQPPTLLISEIRESLTKKDYDTAKAKCDAVSCQDEIRAVNPTFGRRRYQDQIEMPMFLRSFSFFIPFHRV